MSSDTINGMDRLAAAAGGEKSDRIPIFCNLFDQGAEEMGMSRKEYYSKGEYVAEAQLRMREKYGYDNLWSLFYVGKEVEIFGCSDILFPSKGSPNIADFVIRTYDDIHKLEIPKDIPNHPAFQEELKCLHMLDREAGGKYPICAYVTSSMTLPALLMGMDRWMELLFLGPSDVRDELLTKCSDFFTRQFMAYRDAGANVFVYSNPFGSTDTVPMKFIKEHSLPWMKRDLAEVGTEGVVYYGGSSRLNKVIDLVIGHLGISTFYLSPLDDVAEGKKIVAGRGVTCGILNDIPLIDFSPEKIREEVRKIMEAGMPGGKFAFGTIGMPDAIPEANIRAMMDAALEFGSF